jgi:metal transporter CNNM
MYNTVRDVRVDIDGERHPPKICLKNKGIKKSKSSLSSEEKFEREAYKSKRWSNGVHSEVLHIDDNPLPVLTQGEAVGIITLEDVIEEILQVRDFVVFFLPADLIFSSFKDL